MSGNYYCWVSADFVHRSKHQSNTREVQSQLYCQQKYGNNLNDVWEISLWFQEYIYAYKWWSSIAVVQKVSVIAQSPNITHIIAGKLSNERAIKESQANLITAGNVGVQQAFNKQFITEQKFAKHMFNMNKQQKNIIRT